MKALIRSSISYSKNHPLKRIRTSSSCTETASDTAFGGPGRQATPPDTLCFTRNASYMVQNVLRLGNSVREGHIRERFGCQPGITRTWVILFRDVITGFCNGDVHFFFLFIFFSKGKRWKGSRLCRKEIKNYWIKKKQEGLEFARLDISLHNTKEQEEIPRWTRKSLWLWGRRNAPWRSPSLEGDGDADEGSALLNRFVYCYHNDD